MITLCFPHVSFTHHSFIAPFTLQDEFVTKIRDTRLLDDYPEDDTLESTETAPAYNPWPLDEDTSPATMADPLSGEILVTDLQSTEKNKPEPEDEDETLDASAHQEDDPASSSDSDIDDEEAEDLTEEFEKEEFEKERASKESSDHHGDGDTQKDEDGDEDLFPRIDDDVDKTKLLKWLMF